MVVEGEGGVVVPEGDKWLHMYIISRNRCVKRQIDKGSNLWLQM